MTYKEPKQVEIDSYSYTFGSDAFFVDYFGKCPTCGWIFEEGDENWKAQYCSNCGQKLKWFDEACVGCFDDIEHRNYEPKLEQTDFCDDYDLIYCEGKDCSECSYFRK